MKGVDTMKFTLAQARMLSGLTQRQIAEMLGVSEKTYIQYEKYRKVLDMKQAFDFSHFTGISMNEIIFFDGQLQNFCTNTKEVGV